MSQSQTDIHFLTTLQSKGSKLFEQNKRRPCDMGNRAVVSFNLTIGCLQCYRFFGV